MRACSLPILTTNETITNLTQYELSQEESNLSNYAAKADFKNATGVDASDWA